MSSSPVPMRCIWSLALWLRTTRMRAGLTQQHVAEASGIYIGMYGRIERAALMPTEATLQRICLVLKLDYQFLVDMVTRGEEPLRH
ncbi:helix-turn-helix domain-containing protein [Archangium violaceum]|uniref:helix-turn-helix domain-containing protein n=1 Tax=Archangium violaceum TaxID=83451 RepID=UPI0009FFAC4D|nr:helix-turn-helix transcriptional regulator [Archangium violaceum]